MQAGYAAGNVFQQEGTVEIPPGLVGEKEVLVSDALTARHLGSGKVSVLATPAMIMLMELTAMEVVDPYLEPGQQTVGTMVDVQHLCATPEGMTVRIRVELQKVDGRRLTYHVEAFDAREKIGEGMHERAIINLERFEQKLQAKLRG
jgi:fluoroacetyl-CoA thioesterase